MADSSTMVIRVYALEDPITGKRRYVGQTANTLRGRMSSHLRYKPTEKGEWIRAVRRQGVLPRIVLLQQVECTRREAYVYERLWILRLRSQGEPLLNQVISDPDQIAAELQKIEQQVRQIEVVARVREAQQRRIEANRERGLS